VDSAYVSPIQVWQFAVVLAILAFSAYMLIRASRYIVGCRDEQGEFDPSKVDPYKLLKYGVILIAGIFIGSLLFVVPKYNQHIPAKESQALPGGVTEEMVEEVQPPDPGELSRDRAKLRAAQEAAERKKLQDRQGQFRQDRKAYRESMGLPAEETTEAPATTSAPNQQ